MDESDYEGKKVGFVAVFQNINRRGVLLKEASKYIQNKTTNIFIFRNCTFCF